MKEERMSDLPSGRPTDHESQEMEEQKISESPVFTDAEINQASALTQVVIAHCQNAKIGFGDTKQNFCATELADFCVDLFRRLLDETANAKFRAKESIRVESIIANSILQKEAETND